MLSPEQIGIQENLRKQSILSNFKEYNDNAPVSEPIVSNDVQKSEISEDIEKGKPALSGEIREWGGKKYKKQANGKWLEVSESHGMTKEEHEDFSDHNKSRGKLSSPEKRNKFNETSQKHKEIASKLSDKEVGLESVSMGDFKEGDELIDKNGTRHNVNKIHGEHVELRSENGENKKVGWDSIEDNFHKEIKKSETNLQIIENKLTENFEKGLINEELYNEAKIQLDILKSKGEGSKGGKIIGHTKSGKPIYNNASHESHKKFTIEDHEDAINTHQKIRDDYHKNDKSTDKDKADNDYAYKQQQHHIAEKNSYINQFIRNKEDREEWHKEMSKENRKVDNDDVFDE